MINVSIQLSIEGSLSKGIPYLASHPELGVPLGIFNTYDEPTRQSRINSINKLGKGGNPISTKLAKKLGVGHPIPSFVVELVVADGPNAGEVINVTDASFKDALQDQNYTNTSTTRSKYDSGNSKAIRSKLKNITSELDRQRSQADLTLNETLGMISVMTGGAGGGEGGRTAAIQSVYLDILSLTDQFKKDLTSSIGLDPELMDGVIQGVTIASRDFKGFAITVNDAFQVLKSTALETGRAFILPDEALVQATKLEKLYGMDMGKMLAEFDKIGVGSIEATETTNKAIATAGRYGAVVSKFLPSVQSQIEKINTYGFKNGVDGLTEMVAEAQILGYKMNNVYQASDKAFTPEGAIEMASKLQMIGGAASELLDPFQLMYMAQNDVDALKDSLVKTAESAVSFNEATGDFGITPAERLRLKAIAEATGQDYDNLAETAIKAAKRTQAIGKLGGIPELSKQDKELIASMADINPDGEFLLKMGDQEIGFDQLADAMAEDSTLLETLQKQSKKEGMDLDEVNKAQLTVQEGMAANVSVIQTFLTSMAASGELGTSAQDFAAALANSDFGDKLIAGDVGKMFSDGDQKSLSMKELLSTTTTGFGSALEYGAKGTGLSEAYVSAKGGYTGDSPVGYVPPVESPSGGPLNASDIDAYLNSPEGQQIVNNYNNSNNKTYGGNTPTANGNNINITFSPLEILYDGNSIKLTDKQIHSALTPFLIRELSSAISIQNNPGNKQPGV
tara:strand:+ start:3447 stop:5654 length:2208 start_codon:yes stop_codon:yes gene_type:complete